jgi:hypothetical protein
MATKKVDPTEDPKFKSVVRHFLTTKPKPHAESKNAKGRARKGGDRARKNPRGSNSGA